MTFETTPLAGPVVIGMERFTDDRGFFGYTFDAAAFAGRGLPSVIVQSNVSFNNIAGTLRGMHFQRDPSAQPKLVRCTRGRIFDVVVDVRPGSPTERKWFGIELSAETQKALFIPAGFAHGFQTRVDQTEVLYEMFTPYAPASAAGVRFDDPAFGIEWPMQVTSISDRDRTYADYGR
jgi:dTDP-4-dehydrorhamnose 3,5-epimerase